MQAKAIAERIGAGIRRARTARAMTLAALAGRAGLSEAFLSRVERGEASSSVANLVKIAAGLGLGLQDLLGESVKPERTVLAVHRGSEADRDSELESTGYRWHRIVGGAPRDRIAVFHLVFPKRNRMRVMVSHPGQEHCYVLSGEIAFFAGGERHHLRAGDSIFIASEQPHRAEAAGGGEAHVLMTVAKPEHEPEALDWWRMPISGACRRPDQSKPRTKEEIS